MKREGIADHYFLVANIYEGCSHKHRTQRSAEVCFSKLRKRGWRGSIYLMHRGDNKRIRRLQAKELK